MIHTEYITLNGFRDVIKNYFPMLRQLKSEGWVVDRPKFYKNHESKSRDYITILIHKDFKL